MCAFFRLIASEVTNVNRNCVGRPYVRVRACVCMWATGLAYVALRGENYMGIGQIRRHIGDANLAGNN